MLEHQISSSLSRFSLSFLSPLLVYQLITTIQLELNKAKNENKTTNNEFSYQLFMQNLIQGLGPKRPKSDVFFDRTSMVDMWISLDQVASHIGLSKTGYTLGHSRQAILR